MATIRALPTVDLPYDFDHLRYGASAEQRKQARDYSLDVLRGKTNLIRLAYDYNESYRSAPEKSVLHYRDYLISEAAMASMTSVLYTDSKQIELNSRSERVLATLPKEKIWAYRSKQDLDTGLPKYSGSPGSPAYYFNITDINEYPIQTFQRLAEAVWSINGVDPATSPSGRLTTIYRYIALPSDIEDRLQNILRDIERGTTPLREAELYARRNLVTAEDIRDIQKSILYGTYSPEVISTVALYLEPSELEILQRSLRYSNTLAAPGGFNLLLQTLVMEGYANAASVLDSLPDTVAFSKLTDFLYLDSGYQDEKFEIGSNLNLAANALALIHQSGLIIDAQRSMAKAFNNSLYWMEASGKELGVEKGMWHSLQGFVDSLFPSMSRSLVDSFPLSSVMATDSFFSNLQGRPRKNYDSVLTPNKTFGYNIFFDLFSTTRPSVNDGTLGDLSRLGEGIDPNAALTGPQQAIGGSTGATTELDPGLRSAGTEQTTLATITPDGPPSSDVVVESNPGTLSTSDNQEPDVDPSLSAYFVHSGPETVVTYSQYESIESASNVVVVQPGLPAVDLSPQISSAIDKQTRAYEMVNTLHIAPTPRGILGYEELTRGMVSHLFRDSTSDDYLNRVKIDGAREEHTARIGGLLQQLQTTHLDSEIKVLKRWSSAVDQIL